MATQAGMIVTLWLLLFGLGRGGAGQEVPNGGPTSSEGTAGAQTGSRLDDQSDNPSVRQVDWATAGTWPGGLIEDEGVDSSVHADMTARGHWSSGPQRESRVSDRRPVRLLRKVEADHADFNFVVPQEMTGGSAHRQVDFRDIVDCALRGLKAELSNFEIATKYGPTVVRQVNNCGRWAHLHGGSDNVSSGHKRPGVINKESRSQEFLNACRPKACNGRHRRLKRLDRGQERVGSGLRHRAQAPGRHAGPDSVAR